MVSTGVPQDETRSVSVRLDGRASIEHQLEIHIQDLVEAGENPDISIMDVLEGLHYVMEYRIHGGKMKNLDAELMKKLANALLGLTGAQTGSLLSQRPTPEADLAFNLFGDFLAEVHEFRNAVANYSAFDLCSMLKIHRRCQSRSTKEQRQSAAGILGYLTTHFTKFSDWKELIKEDEYDCVEKLNQEFPKMFEKPTMPVSEDLFPPPALYFDKNVQGLADMYRTSTSTGLTTAQVEKFRLQYGLNKLPDPPKPSLWHMLWTQVTDFMVLILILAAVAEFATEDYKAGGVLMFVVVLNVIIGTTQEYKANQALEALMNLAVPKATVIRNGTQESIDASGLVPGDLVVLEEGDAVPADLRLCEVAQLEIIEAILTGESLPVSKSVRTIRKKTRRLPLGDCKGNAFMTTVVAKGRGRGIVVRTGLETEIGKITSAISSNPSPKTSLERDLSFLGKILVAIAFGLCVLIIIIGIFGWKREFMTMLKIGVSLAVSVIPEGLVAVVTVAMAFGVQRMLAKNAIVRKLPSVETLGSVNVICSDKTGTLTEGKMGTELLWTTDNTSFSFTHSTSLDPNKGEAHMTATRSLANGIAGGNPDMDADVGSTKTQTVAKVLADAPSHFIASMMVAGICNNSAISFDEESKAWKATGDPTEVAMTVAAEKSGMARDFFFNTVGIKKLGEYAFDSDRKLMSVIIRLSKTESNIAEDTCFVLVKGAPESVLQHSTGYLGDSETPGSLRGLSHLASEPKSLSDGFVDYVTKQSALMASKGLRVLGLALRKVTLDQANDIVKANKFSAAECDLTFVGLIGLIDPPKAGVKEAVATCKKAGIRVIMITGDHVATATAIAKQLGIMEPSDSERNRSMKGYEIDMLSEEALAAQRPFPVVFARVSPDNKLKIVKALQSKGLSIAMTGDGVNDAPAIKKADIGIAMGVGGTELTKQAADIVLADDNFCTIVDAAKEGRQVFDNIRKFVVYLLSCNSAEIFLFLICVSIGQEMPFTTIQILWANIVADIPPATALGLEPAESDIMERPPRPITEGVVTVKNWVLVFIQGMVLTLISFGVFMLARTQNLAGLKELPQHQSLTFVTLTMMQLFQGFLSRSVTQSVFTTGLLGNKILVYSDLAAMVLIAIGAEVPGIKDMLEIQSIGGWGWLVAFVCMGIQFVLIEVAKFLLRNQPWAKSVSSRTKQPVESQMKLNEPSIVVVS